MSDALRREDDALAAALVLRYQNVGVRCAVAVVGALAFEPLVGTMPALIWVSVFLFFQGIEAFVFGRYLRSQDSPMTVLRRSIATGLMFISNAIYGGLTLLMWGQGLATGACAILVLAGGAANAVMNTAGSRLALAATLSPVIVYFGLSPWLALQAGAAPAATQALAMACVIFGGFILTAYNQAQKLSQSERNARRSADSRRAALELAGQSKSAFIASVAHDLRTPLSAIMTGAAEMHRQAGDGTERSHAALIQDAGEMMNRLLDDLLDHARLEAGRMEIEPQVFNLRDLLARSARFWQGQAQAKGIRLVVEGGRRVPAWVEADPVRVRQILNNLLSNAVKFTSHGEVRVRLNAWPTDDDRCALTVEVSDTGAGMNADQQKRLFTAFDQTRAGVAGTHGGSGLGLWISRDLARLMDGRLTVRSEPGKGSAFTLALTLETVEAPSMAPAQPDVGAVASGFAPLVLPAEPLPMMSPMESLQTPDSYGAGAKSGRIEPVGSAADEDENDSPLRVLVVDDHDINRRAIQLILTPLGCEISQADNGRTALDMAMAQSFDVIFMDVRMPELDGRETTRQLRAMAGPSQNVPVIAVTADTAPEDVRACAEAGMTWFVGKPLSPATLLSSLQGVLSGESRFEHDQTRAA